jgi:Kef-type K+ transport system membrane component KefB
VSGIGLLLLLGIGVLVAAALAFGAWVVRPVDRAARGRRHPPQFSLFDFLCLFVLIQLPTGLVHGLLDVSREFVTICILDVFGWGACGAMWWVSVRTLSQAGVSNPRHRAVFLLLALPIAIFGSLALPAILLVIVAMIAEPRARAPATIGLLIAAALALFGVIYLCGRYTRWMLAAVPGRDANAAAQPSSNSSEQPRISERRHGDLPTEPRSD